jgi:hypothetical protein
MDKGHYFCLTKRPLDGTWWFCNDSEIRCLGGQQLSVASGKTSSQSSGIEKAISCWQKKVYLLMYERVEEPVKRVGQKESK